MVRVWSRAVVTAAASATLVAAIGATMTDLGPWYRSLEKPALQPPDIVFPIAWTAIYGLTAAAGVLAWRAMRSEPGREWLIGLFALNGFLNLLWSFLFFRLQRPDWAMIEWVPFWLSILAMIVMVWPRSRTAGLLLVPYLVWVGFAGWLNWEVVRLNAPFGGLAS
jgi:tryptophan-rich sensory protein